MRFVLVELTALWRVCSVRALMTVAGIGVHICPLLCLASEDGGSCSILIGDIGHKAVVRVWGGHEGLNGCKHCGYIEGRFPCAVGRHVETVETNAPFCVDVRVVYLGEEADAGRFEGVFARDMELETEDAGVVRGVCCATDLGIEQI